MLTMSDQNLKLMQPLGAYRVSFFLVECISDHSVAAFGDECFLLGNLHPIVWTDVRSAPMTATSITRYRRRSV